MTTYNVPQMPEPYRTEFINWFKEAVPYLDVQHVKETVEIGPKKYNGAYTVSGSLFLVKNGETVWGVDVPFEAEADTPFPESLSFDIKEYK